MSFSHHDLLSLESYARQRSQLRPVAIEQRRQRQVRLDRGLLLQFENDATVRYQIQEVLRAERLFEPGEIREQLEAYTPLMSDGHSWTATLFLEFPDPALRRVMLDRWAGIEQVIYLRPAHSTDRCLATASTDTLGQPSAVHFLRFSPRSELLDWLAADPTPALQLGCDHPHCRAEIALPPPLIQQLKLDLNRFRSG